MDFYDAHCDFLSEKLEIKHLKSPDGKAFVNYLIYIFEKLNLLNKQLRDFMDFYDAHCDFLSEKLEIKHLKSPDGKAFVNYLIYIFEKLNLLNKQLQG